MKKRTRKPQYARIYYGPDGNETSLYWTVAVTDAREEISINGTVSAALRAHRGVTVGCAMSLASFDSAQHFKHPVYLVSVTKSSILVVDRLNKDGSPAHAVRYGHSYGHIVEKNDDGTLRKLVEEEPTVMERPFKLRPPRKRPTGPHGNHKSVSTVGVNRSIVHLHGALDRAVKAGRISKPAAEQLSRAMSRRKGTSKQVATT